MGRSEYDPGVTEKPAWNAGRGPGAKRARKPQQVWAIRFWLDCAMFDLAFDSKPRGAGEAR